MEQAEIYLQLVEQIKVREMEIWILCRNRPYGRLSGEAGPCFWREHHVTILRLETSKKDCWRLP